jgi:hypothetical protein
MSFLYDYGEEGHSGGSSGGGGARIDPGGTVRDHLIAALAAISTDVQARAVVDALDAYLEEGPGREVMTWENLTPNYRSELEKVRAERDTAIDCAQQVLKKMQDTLDSLRASPATDAVEK